MKARKIRNDYMFFLVPTITISNCPYTFEVSIIFLRKGVEFIWEKEK